MEWYNGDYDAMRQDVDHFSLFWGVAVQSQLSFSFVSYCRACFYSVRFLLVVVWLFFSTFVSLEKMFFRVGLLFPVLCDLLSLIGASCTLIFYLTPQNIPFSHLMPLFPRAAVIWITMPSPEYLTAPSPTWLRLTHCEAVLTCVLVELLLLWMEYDNEDWCDVKGCRLLFIVPGHGSAAATESGCLSVFNGLLLPRVFLFCILYYFYWLLGYSYSHLLLCPLKKNRNFFLPCFLPSESDRLFFLIGPSCTSIFISPPKLPFLCLFSCFRVRQLLEWK